MHLYFFPLVLQVDRLLAMALLEVDVQFVAVPLGEVILNQGLHIANQFSCIPEAVEFLQFIDNILRVLQ